MKLTAADEQLARTVAAMDVCGSPTGQYAADVREDSNRRYTSYCVKASNGPPVRLAPADGRPRLVACKARIGCFALHRPWGWKQKDGPVWNVTHESSGLAAATQVRTLPTARAIAKRLMADFADVWTFDDPKDRDRSHDKEILEVMRSIQYGGTARGERIERKDSK